MSARCSVSARRGVVALVALSALAAGCARDAQDATPLATVSMSVTPTEAAVGTPIDMTYNFVVAPNPPPVPDDLWVFVHFLDSDGERMWTDDHQPPAPPSDWKPGATVRYTRTTFVPRYPYVGEAYIDIGLYSRKTGERFVLTGSPDVGLRSYRTSQFNLRLKVDAPYVAFADGWYDVEGTRDAGGNEWRWSKKAARLSFRNPKRDVVLVLEADEPVQLPEPRRVEIQLGSTVLDSFALTANQRELRRVTIPASLFGNREGIEVTITVDKTFVPKAIPSLGSPDGRELGIRVFHAYVR